MKFFAEITCFCWLVVVTNGRDISKEDLMLRKLSDIEEMLLCHEQEISQLKKTCETQQRMIEEQSKMIKEQEIILHKEKQRNDEGVRQMANVKAAMVAIRRRLFQSNRPESIDKEVVNNEVKELPNNDNKNRIIKRQVPGGVAAFSAYLSHDADFGQDQTIKFDQVLTNEGNSYNIHSGVFTCPLGGVYLFSFSIGERDTYGIYAFLKVNSVNIIDAAVDTFHATQDLQGGNTVVLRLNAGDVVWISTNKYHAEGSNSARFTSFTGVYLYE